MARYRKRPIVIEAVQWWPPGDERWPGAIEGVEVLAAGPHHPELPLGAFLMAFVETLEGKMTVSPGDWIITGVKGEKYPCKPDIFEATYEPETAGWGEPVVPLRAAATMYLRPKREADFWRAAFGEAIRHQSPITSWRVGEWDSSLPHGGTKQQWGFLAGGELVGFDEPETAALAWAARQIEKGAPDG